VLSRLLTTIELYNYYKSWFGVLSPPIDSKDSSANSGICLISFFGSRVEI
jgi:hypothetical protein